MTFKCTDRSERRSLCGRKLPWTKGSEQNNTLVFFAVSMVNVGIQTNLFYWLEYKNISAIKCLRSIDRLYQLIFACTCFTVGCCLVYAAEFRYSSERRYTLNLLRVDDQDKAHKAHKAYNALLASSCLCFFTFVEALAFSFVITVGWDYWLTQLGLVVPIGSICACLVGVLVLYVSFTSGGSEQFAASIVVQNSIVHDDLLKEQPTQAGGHMYSDRYTRRFR
eukprot:COSAG02_NODE_5267_length_4484_cov_40.310376_2_plen_222_part_00